MLKRLLKHLKEKPLLSILIVFTSIIAVNRFLLCFDYTFNLGGVENYFIYLVLKANSIFLYSDVELLPFEVNQYSPLHFYFMRIFYSLASLIGGDEVRWLYVCGRLFSLFFNVASCYLIFKIFTKVLDVRKSYALIIALLSFNLFINHHYAARPDSLKTLFILAAIYKVGYFIKLNEKKYLLFGVIYSALAILTKQDALIFIVAISILIIKYDNLRNSFLYLTGAGVLTVIVLLISGSFDINILYQNLIVGIGQGSSIPWLKTIVKTNFLQFLGMGILLVSIFSLKTAKVDIINQLLLFIIFFVGISLAKWGSDMNYLLEIQILMFSILIYKYYNKKIGIYKYILVVAFAFIIIGNQKRDKLIFFNYWSYKVGNFEYSKLKEKLSEVLLEVDKNEIKHTITFDANLSLMLHSRNILGTLVNEYPEIYFPGIGEITGDLPNTTYNYSFNCSSQPKIALISDKSEIERDKEFLSDLFQQNFKWEQFSTMGKNVITTINCN